MRSIESINFMRYKSFTKTVKGHTDFIPLEIRVFAHGFHYIVMPFLEFIREFHSGEFSERSTAIFQSQLFSIALDESLL